MTSVPLSRVKWMLEPPPGATSGSASRRHLRRPSVTLKGHTAEALARGVPGIPTVAIGSELFWGDDRLEEAAAAAGG